jgi:hypothetical protein
MLPIHKPVLSLGLSGGGDGGGAKVSSCSSFIDKEETRFRCRSHGHLIRFDGSSPILDFMSSTQVARSIVQASSSSDSPRPRDKVHQMSVEDAAPAINDNNNGESSLLSDTIHDFIMLKRYKQEGKLLEMAVL